MNDNNYRLDCSKEFWIDAVNSVLIVAITDKNGNILYANQKFCERSGYSRRELIGSNHRILNSSVHSKIFFQKMYETISNGKVWRGEICNKSKEGSLYWVDTTIIPRHDNNGCITHYVVCRYDITEQKKAQKKLTEIACTDPLTGIGNRNSFQEFLNKSIQYHSSSSSIFAVLMLDIDNFKDINDIYGHEIGDKLLKIMAERIQKTIRSTDFVARFGGDEFVIIISPVSSDDELNEILKEIQRRVWEPLNLSIDVTNIEASLGVARYPEDGVHASELVKNADIALYSAKRLGRGRYEFFTNKMNMEAINRVKLLDDARRGLEKGEFILYYQPIVRLSELKVEHFEALLRWNHPKFGVLAPGQFFEVLEDQRLAFAIGQLVRRKVVVQAAAWERSGIPFRKIAINATSADFSEVGYTEALLSELAEHSLTSASISIEVTEGMFLGKKASRIHEELKALHCAGFNIAFDDFGTGFASLTHLRELPLYCIKIDRSFVINMTNSMKDQTIIRSIIKLAHGIDLSVIAEGVETVEQLQLLREMGCDHIQGYLISKPIKADDVPTFCQVNLLRESRMALMRNQGEIQRQSG